MSVELICFFCGKELEENQHHKIIFDYHTRPPQTREVCDLCIHITVNWLNFLKRMMQPLDWREEIDA